MTHVTAPPRVGLVGLGRTGSHLLERFSSGGPLRIVAGWDDAPEGIRLAESLGEMVPGRRLAEHRDGE